MSTDRLNDLPDGDLAAMLGELNVDPRETRQTPTLECTIQIKFLLTLRLVLMMTLVCNTSQIFQSLSVQSFNQLWTIWTDATCAEDFVSCGPRIAREIKLLGTVFESKCSCNGHAGKQIQDRGWIALANIWELRCLRLVDARHGGQIFMDKALILSMVFTTRFSHQVLRESEEVLNRLMAVMILFCVHVMARWPLSTQEAELWMHEPLEDSLENRMQRSRVHPASAIVWHSWQNMEHHCRMAGSWISFKFKRTA